GTLFQSSALFDSMTVAENVGFSLVENLRLPAGQVSDIVKDKLEWVAMSGYENQMPSQLSGGQRKRVGLARALAADPEIMLYDEPTTGLDPITSTHIEDLIVKLTQTRRVTSVVVSHQISTILRTADKIYMMYEGQLLPPESPATIANSADPRIREFIRGGLS
ncbi:MAG: ATP-binding cassette domain-containing protein, partial [Candidatus Margulisiibacteriota bacterium]